MQSRSMLKRVFFSALGSSSIANQIFFETSTCADNSWVGCGGAGGGCGGGRVGGGGLDSPSRGMLFSAALGSLGVFWMPPAESRRGPTRSLAFLFGDALTATLASLIPTLDDFPPPAPPPPLRRISHAQTPSSLNSILLVMWFFCFFV